MAILWCGGEDIDFQNGSLPIALATGGRFRTGYARSALAPLVANAMKGSQFPGGAVTSAWLSFRAFKVNATTSTRWGGFGQFSSLKGLMVGSNASTATKLTLYKYDGRPKDGAVHVGHAAYGDIARKRNKQHSAEPNVHGGTGAIAGDLYIDFMERAGC
jgi:hypothetical protein